MLIKSDTKFCRLQVLLALASAAIVFSAILTISGCSSDDDSTDGGLITGFTYDAEWPSDVNVILTADFPDSTNDQVALPPEMAGPPYSGPVSFPPVDVTMISLGVDRGFLYMRVEYAGTIPSSPVTIQASGEVEHQIVKNQGMNIALDSDNDQQTGAAGEGIWGVDIFFAVSFDYGIESMIYANYDFPDGDVHHNTQQVIGELGEGGPGYDYAVVRYDISGLGEFFVLGSTIQFGSWSEAESFNTDGSLKYHHFAFDPFDAVTWDIPAL